MKKNYNIADPEWEWYIGQLYYQLIKSFYDQKINCVVELAPGFRHKIADALKEINFSGTLYVIDYSSDVLEYIKDKYKSILPNAKIVCINKKFEDCLELIPDKIDLFLSNHSIDDLIISNYSSNYYSSKINNEFLHDDLLKLWKELYYDKNSIELITNNLKKIYNKLFSKKDIGLIIMSQYKSNSYFLDNEYYMDEIVTKCFNEIKDLTDTNDIKVNKVLDFYPFGKADERYNGKYLIDNTQNAKNWIVGKYIKNM